MMSQKTLRWGILGTASITETMIPAIQRCRNSSLYAIASRSQTKAEAWADRYAIPKVFSSYESLLASGEVDMVYIPLPNSLHAEWTIRALHAGLDVLCEKPIALNAQEAQTIAEVASQHGKLVVEAFMYRHHPIYECIRQVIAQGKIGRLISLHSEFSFLLDEPDSIVADAGLGGGALMDVGCYCIHLSRLIAGAEPQQVSAFSIFRGVDRSMSGVLEFPGGILATFSTSIESAERHRVEIHGETGVLVLKKPWHPGEDQAGFILQRHGEPDQFIPVTGENAYNLQAQEFVDAVSGQTPARWPVSDAVANMAVLDALKQSATTHIACTPRLPPSSDDQSKG